MIENYENLNRTETLEAVADFGTDQLQEFIDFERHHKDRKTVIEPLEDELVTVATDGRQYVAGLWFDDVDEEMTVRRSPRIEKAIDAGDLEEVHHE